jgi:hypothetical protein
MKKPYVIGLIAAATLSLATSAWAGFWSNYVTIANLDTAVDGYVVYPGTSAGNPGNCASVAPGSVSPIYMYSGATAAEKDLMNKTLISAFLSNRKVRLNVASTVCTAAGYPEYIAVRLDAVQ